MSEFRRIFSAFYNELWSIQPVERKPTGIKLHMFVDSAKVRFCCDVSGQVLVSFFHYLIHLFVFFPTEMRPQLDVDEGAHRLLVQPPAAAL